MFIRVLGIIKVHWRDILFWKLLIDICLNEYYLFKSKILTASV